MCLLQESKSETSLDMAQISHSHWPGRPSRFILIGRNVKQWRMSIDYIDVDEEVVSDVTPQPKSAKSKTMYKTSLSDTCTLFICALEKSLINTPNKLLFINCESVLFEGH